MNEHLLPGLDTIGVDKKLKGSIHPFGYNNYKELKKLIKKIKSVGIVVVESARYDYPDKNFVANVNKICKEKNDLILICDEITSGFRISNSGAYKKIGFKPDIVVYVKGLGNGFPITAIVGKKIMMSAQKSFISSSNWSERIGFSAALKTIDIIEKKKVWMHIDGIGKQIRHGWLKIFKKYVLKIKVRFFTINYNET